VLAPDQGSTEVIHYVFVVLYGAVGVVAMLGYWEVARDIGIAIASIYVLFAVYIIWDFIDKTRAAGD